MSTKTRSQLETEVRSLRSKLAGSRRRERALDMARGSLEQEVENYKRQVITVDAAHRETRRALISGQDALRDEVDSLYGELAELEESHRASRRARRGGSGQADVGTANIHIRSVGSDEATIADVVYRDERDSRQYAGNGTAKRCPGDHRNPRAGRLLATGRALLELGHRLIDEARNEVG